MDMFKKTMKEASVLLDAIIIFYSLGFGARCEARREAFSQLESLADTDGKPGLSISEKSKMYEMCGLNLDNVSANYRLNPEEIKLGIANYNSLYNNQ